MFEAIRKGLTRSELATITNRSINYILKAEQATFPAPPIALLDYYVQQGYDRDILVSEYYDFQRRKREAWLEQWEPVPYSAGRPFRKKWRRLQPSALNGGAATVETGLRLSGFFSERVDVYPTQYGLSVGLCLPAAVLYRNEKDLSHAGAIRACMVDLVDYVESGRFTASVLSDDSAPGVIEGVLRIALEEGVEKTRAA